MKARRSGSPPIFFSPLLGGGLHFAGLQHRRMPFRRQNKMDVQILKGLDPLKKSPLPCKRRMLKKKVPFSSNNIPLYVYYMIISMGAQIEDVAIGALFLKTIFDRKLVSPCSPIPPSL